ncbi:MAG: hypothetical protein ACXWCH_31915, partial [Burkholderiales bacterium]
KAIGCAPPRYLAMYSIESPDVYTSAPYKNIGGGGSQSSRFHYAYATWTRNLFDGASHAPSIEHGQRVLVFDRTHRDENGPLASRAIWLEAVGLHMTTRYRAFVVVDAAEASNPPVVPGSYIYEPFTASIRSTAK